MSIEELLKRRVKLIAPIPFYSNKVGEMLETTNQGIFIDPDFDDASSFCIIWEDVPKYPHLFREISWWEDRDEKDFPSHIKSKTTGKVLKAVFGRQYKWDNILPATEEEYLNQIK